MRSKKRSKESTRRCLKAGDSGAARPDQENKKCQPKPTIAAGIALYSVATTAARGETAIAGNSASPSFDIAFANCAENGINPLRYIVVTTTCGPQPGIKPMTIAVATTASGCSANSVRKSKPAKATRNS